MMKFKKLLFILLTFSFVLSMMSCFLFEKPEPDPENPGSDTEDAVSGSEKIINVYLIAGQSNAVGYGMDTGKAIANSDERFTKGFENVLYYGSQERWNGEALDKEFKPVTLGMGVAADRSGAEIGIASSIADNGEMNAIIKCAQGATHIYPDAQYDVSINYGTWTSPSYIEKHNIDLSVNPMIGYMYTRFENTVREGLELLIAEGYTPVIKGVWWMQGEAEMFTVTMASAYRELYETLISDTRNMLSEVSGYDCSNTPFVCGLPKWNTKNSAAPAYQNMVRASMTTVASNVTNAACVDCMPLNQHDDWHFDAAGQKVLGEEFIKKLKSFEGDELFGESVSINSEIKLLTSKKGLQFRADLTKYNSENKYQYGFIVVPTEKFQGINGNYVSALDAAGISYQNLTSKINLEKTDGEYSDIYFTCDITDIAYADMNTAYTAIAYIKDEYGNYAYSSRFVYDSIARLASEELYKEGADVNALLKIVNAGINYMNNLPEESSENDPDFELTADDITLAYSQAEVSQKLQVVKSVDVDYFVRYSSANPDIASVDKNGVVTAHKNGSTTVLVECAGKSKRVQVTVDYLTVDGIRFDGVISEGEYVGDVIITSNGNVSSEVVGMVKNGNLHLAFSLVHGEWSPLNSTWWLNDNVEVKLNGGTSHTVVFYEGVATYSNNISYGMSKTEEIDGKLVTTIEICVEDVPDVNQVMICANGTNFGWLAIVHHNVCNTGYINEDGIIVAKPIELDNGLVLDGAFDESIYTESVKSNVISANGNGAGVEIMGTLTGQGIVLGVKINHTKSPDVTIVENGDWYTYMNIEFHFNSRSGESDQYMFFANNREKVTGRAFSYCNTVQTEGGYVSSIEIFIPYETIGVSAGVESVEFTARGWFETDWCDLLNTSWDATHRIAVNGLAKID